MLAVRNQAVSSRTPLKQSEMELQYRSGIFTNFLIQIFA